MTAWPLRNRGRDFFRRTEARVDASLSVMLCVQVATMFVVIPLGWRTGMGRGLLDACHMSFATIGVCVLARRWATRGILLLVLVALLCQSAFNLDPRSASNFDPSFAACTGASVALAPA